MSILHYHHPLQPIPILFLLLSSSFHSAAFAAAGYNYDVASFGAKPDGKTDSTKAFISTWQEACGSAQAAVIYVASGRFLLGKALFGGPCNNKAISLTIDGTLVAPSNYEVAGDDENWIVFTNVDGVSVRGGLLDGRGTSLWSCKNSGRNCSARATSLEFTNSKNINIVGVTSLNSQMFHIGIQQSQHVKLEGVKVVAAGNSPNTDGVHIRGSDDVTILNTNIRTGGNCVSIGPGSTNLWIQNMSCGPGHGISIGSLGKDKDEDGVQNVTVKRVKFTGTENGVRIETWGKPSNAFVRDVLFQHAVMVNVKNPIIIVQNQKDCPDEHGCPDPSSGAKISDVAYKHIHGTSATEVAVKFECSRKNPCSGIRLEDVKLTFNNHVALASCHNAGGTSQGSVLPQISCLQQ